MNPILASPYSRASGLAASGFPSISRPPDLIQVHTEHGVVPLSLTTPDHWNATSIELTTSFIGPESTGMKIMLSAEKDAVERIHLRWWNGTISFPSGANILGDAWERAYGDLGWRTVEAGRIMPWYFIGADGNHSQCYGVMTGPSALCFWTVDDDGISLWADVRSGGVGVQLGQRVLDVATVVSRASNVGESVFQTLHAFCKQMCPSPRLADHSIYGHNDWDFFYGRQTEESTLEVARQTVALSPMGLNKPYIVIDDGWEGDTNYAVTRGPWDHGNPKFPNMPGIAAKIKEIGGRPGIWMRPTSAWDGLPDNWRLGRDHGTLDPTVPEAKAQMTADIARVASWGFELLKPDFLTVDILGRYGPDFGADLTDNGWTFREGPIRTTAEVVIDLYNTIRSAAGSMVVIGCNTLSHLAAGIFEAARIGDDTSGTNWERTRKMGVNCLAFRLAQNRAFYQIDPDIAPVTAALPWDKSKQWLNAVSSSGAVTFTSIEMSFLGPEQKDALRAAFANAAQASELPFGSADDWMSSNNPRQWTLNGKTETFDWQAPTGATPFNV